MARDRPLIIAHRGFSEVFPENTHSAFEAAVGVGADAIELDLQLTRDGRLIAYHDQTLQRMDGTRDRVRDLTLAEPQDRDFGGWFGRRFLGEPPATLDEILRRYAHRVQLMLELKTDDDDDPLARDLAEAASQRIESAGLGDRIRLLSFDARTLRAAKRLAPRLRRIRNVEFRPELASLTGLTRGMDGLCFPGRHVSAALAGTLRDRGREVFTYRCDTARTVRRALRSGVDGLMADDPTRLAHRVEAESEP